MIRGPARRKQLIALSLVNQTHSSLGHNHNQHQLPFT